MKNKDVILLKALLNSTSQGNIFRNCHDKKKRGKVIGNLIGFGILHVMFIVYSAAATVGFGFLGVINEAPTLCALIISALAFIITLFRTNGYLFAFKEYDMLMSLPFEVKSVVACKFLYMYFRCLPWYADISLPIMVVYGIFKKPAIAVYPLWIVLSLFLPIIPMLLASFFGFFITKISSGFKKKNIVQTILMFVLVIFAFSIQFIMNSFFKNEDMEVALENLSDMMQGMGDRYFPIKWFSGAILNLSILDALALAVATVLLFELVIYIVGRSYRKINSALKSHAASKEYKMTSLKKSNVLHAIVFKEYRRLTGCPIYMTNAGIGAILAVILGILVLIFGFDKIVTIVLNGAPIPTNILHPAIPLIVYFFIGMVATTAISPSLEGKNYWIVQSLPIEKKVLYQGKMLFNMYLCVPAMIVSVTCLCISAHVPFISTMLYLLLGVVLCAFSTAWGCVCGIKYMRLDWENEVEVAKQGAAVTLYLLPNMFVTMGLVVLVVFLGTMINADLILLILLAVISVLTVLSYWKVVSYN